MRWFEDQTGAVYKVPFMGGQEKELVALTPLAYPGWVDRQRLTWSPDGQWLAFSERSADEGPFRIVRFSLETLEKEFLTSPPQDSLGDVAPEFSPDGSQIVFSRSGSKVWGNEDLWLHSISGGDARPQNYHFRVLSIHADRRLWLLALQQSFMLNQGPAQPLKAFRQDPLLLCNGCIADHRDKWFRTS